MVRGQADPAGSWIKPGGLGIPWISGLLCLARGSISLVLAGSLSPARWLVKWRNHDDKIFIAFYSYFIIKAGNITRNIFNTVHFALGNANLV